MRHQIQGIFVLALLWGAAPLFAADVKIEPAQGRFLVASRRIGDPNFAETVILLINYNTMGAMGVVINRPTDITVATALPDVKVLQKRKDVLYIGGPVARGQMLLIARSPQAPAEALHIFADVYTIAGRSPFEQLLDSKRSTQFRAYLGHAGWAPIQLDFEVKRGDWHILKADVDSVFNTKAEDIWPTLIRQTEMEWTNRHRHHPPLLLSTMITP